MQNHDPHVRVACYVRKSSLVAPVDSTLRTLDSLETEGIVDELTVGAWPAEVRLDDTGLHSDVVDLFEEFDAWADQWDVTIRPPFAVESRTSEITGEAREILITPVQCLAVYVGGALAEVFPHSTARSGDVRTYTVQDALTLLEENDIQAVDAGRYPEMRPGRRLA